MARRSGSSSSFAEGSDDSHLFTPLFLPQRTEADDDLDASTARTITSHHENSPPISGQIPVPTGGVHSFQTTEYLRHRHHHINQSSSFSTPQKSQPDDLRSMSLDDADAAAGARALDTGDLRDGGIGSEPRRRSLNHSAERRKSRSLGHVSPSEYLPSPPHHAGMISLRDHSTNFFNNMNHERMPPPGAKKIERLHGVAGSEHDFLLLSSSASLQSEFSTDSMSEGGDFKHRRRSGTKGTSSRSESFPPLMVAGGIVPSNALPPIEGSPSNEKIRAFGPNVGDLSIPNSPTATLDSKNKFVVLGWDMSNYTRRSQFLISASGTFFFSLLYGYLQELISVELCHRKLGLFLAATQFLGYTILSYFFRNLDKGSSSGGSGNSSSGASNSRMSRIRRLRTPWKLRGGGIAGEGLAEPSSFSKMTVPLEVYVGLSMLRAIDLGMTNLAMQYVNYPAKTLMKSTRVVFTMLFGVLVTKKRYGMADYSIVGLMVAGLGMFMHADATNSAVFQPLGIIMLTISLLCDGAISNMSEAIMNKYEVGQDEYIYRLYSVALFFVSLAAGAKGDLRDGLVYLTTPGTIKEMEENLDPTWSISGKLITMILFSTTGFLGSSCSAAITKSFGALTMSITSTARKATTIFLSFALFPNECTLEHILGIILFIGSLIAKSFRASRHGRHQHHQHHHHLDGTHATNGKTSLRDGQVMEMGSGGTCNMSPLFLRRKNFADDAV